MAAIFDGNVAAAAAAARSINFLCVPFLLVGWRKSLESNEALFFSCILCAHRWYVYNRRVYV